MVSQPHFKIEKNLNILKKMCELVKPVVLPSVFLPSLRVCVPSGHSRLGGWGGQSLTLVQRSESWDSCSGHGWVLRGLWNVGSGFHVDLENGCLTIFTCIDYGFSSLIL